MKSNIIELDVRPILASGVDPFEKIMEKLNHLEKFQSLLIINTFEPIPLLNIVKEKGYTYITERPEEGVVHTFIKIDENNTKVKDINDEPSEEDIDFCVIQTKFKDKLTEVDVRDLEMPLPMVTILEEVEKINADSALYVHHKRLPQYLLPELEKRGFSYVYQEVDESNLKLIIYK